MMRRYDCEILKALGYRLKYFREQSNLSREAAAKHIGVTARTIAAYERGEREASGDLVVKMAELYGVTFTKLTDYKNIMKNNIKKYSVCEGID